MLEVKVPTESERLLALLKNVGTKGKCSGCDAEIAWVKHANGRLAPYDLDAQTYGTNHFVTCPARERFGKGER